MNIAGRVALATGGATGIGLQFVKTLVASGAKHAAILDIDDVRGQQAVEEINKTHGSEKASFHKCDVTKMKEYEDSFKKTIEKYKSIDIVVNGAGIMADSRWELEVELNVKGVIHGVLLGFQYMGKDNGGAGGAIINIASILGLYPVPETPIYCGTKYAVVGMSRAFGDPYHFDRNGIRVMTVCPGATDTKLLSDSPKSMLQNWGQTLGVKIEAIGSQKAEDVAKGIVHMLQYGKTGSVWVVQKDEPPFEVDIPHYNAFRVTDSSADIGKKETEAQELQ